MTPDEKKAEKKVQINNVRIDPIVCTMPKMIARFVRFETGPKGDELFVVYQIHQEDYKGTDL